MGAGKEGKKRGKRGKDGRRISLYSSFMRRFRERWGGADGGPLCLRSFSPRQRPMASAEDGNRGRGGRGEEKRVSKRIGSVRVKKRVHNNKLERRF